MGETVDAITVGAAVVATALAAYAAFLSRAATEAVRADVDLAKNVAKVDLEGDRCEVQLLAAPGTCFARMEGCLRRVR